MSYFSSDDHAIFNQNVQQRNSDYTIKQADGRALCEREVTPLYNEVIDSVKSIFHQFGKVTFASIQRRYSEKEGELIFLTKEYLREKLSERLMNSFGVPRSNFKLEINCREMEGTGYTMGYELRIEASFDPPLT